MSKPIGVRIDTRQEQTWFKFKNFVEKKYGKKHTVLGNELIKAMQIYLELADMASSSKRVPETQIVKEKAGDIEVTSMKEVSYDLLNTIIACRGHLEQLEEDSADLSELSIEKLEKLRQALFKAQKLIEERLEAIR